MVELIEYHKYRPCVYVWRNKRIHTELKEYTPVLTRVFYVNEFIFNKKDAYDMYADFDFDDTMSYFVVINEYMMTRVSIYHLRKFEENANQTVDIHIYANKRCIRAYQDVKCTYNECVIMLEKPIVFIQDDTSDVNVYVYKINNELLTFNNSLMRRKLNNRKLLYELYIISINQNKWE